MRISPPITIVALVLAVFAVMAKFEADRAKSHKALPEGAEYSADDKVANLTTELTQHAFGRFELYWKVNVDGNGELWKPLCFIQRVMEADDCPVVKYRFRMDDKRFAYFNSLAAELRQLIGDGYVCQGRMHSSYGSISWKVYNAEVTYYFDMGCPVGMNFPQSKAIEVITKMNSLVEKNLLLVEPPFATVPLSSIE